MTKSEADQIYTFMMTLVSTVPPVEPPVPPTHPNPPQQIGGLWAEYHLNLGFGKVSVGNLKNTAVVVSLAAPFTNVKLYEDNGGAPLNREYWVTSDLWATPVWRYGGTGPRVVLAPGMYVVFKNYRSTEASQASVEVTN
jgi:hypothetical protein